MYIFIDINLTNSIFVYNMWETKMFSFTGHLRFLFLNSKEVSV